MAPMRDLICGGCDVDVCDIASFPHFRGLCGKVFSLADIACVRQSAMSARPDQPGKRRLHRISPRLWTVFQGLFCTEAISHCRKAASFGESALSSGETR